MKRWQERMKDYERALSRFKEAIDESIVNASSSTLKDGVIQRFEFTYELCWKSMKYYINVEGIEEAKSPRSTFREGFQLGLIHDGELWMDMLKDRNLTSHIYDEELALEIYEKVIAKYYPALKEMYERLMEKDVQ